jgi:XTP/dITP diphosphohydrolase
MQKAKEITFVTTNKGKIASAQQYFKNLKLVTYNYDLIEPRTDDIEEIAKSKVLQAYKIVNQPCIALDSGFFIEELNGFPRAFVNFALDTVGIEGFLKLMEGKTNRKCKFKECLAYYDGKDIQYFYCEHNGILSDKIKGIENPEKWSDLWYIFIPEYSNDGRTLSEYSVEETHERREKIDSSIKQFARWYEQQ